MTLTWLGNRKSAESQTTWLHFLAHFSTDQDEVSCGDEAVQVEHPDTSFEYNVFDQGKYDMMIYTTTLHFDTSV